MSRIAHETKAYSTKDRALHALHSFMSRCDRLPLLAKIKHLRTIAQKPLQQASRSTKLKQRREVVTSHVVPPPHSHIEIAEKTCETVDSETAIARGQFLARQDNWDTLLRELSEAEHTHSRTSTHRPLADLLALGARADVINTAEHALRDGLDPNHAIVLDGIMALERIRIELKRPKLMTTLVALAHIDLGKMYRDAATLNMPHGTAYKKRGIAHFERAQTLLKEMPIATGPATSKRQESPLTLAARCALHTGIDHPVDQITKHYGRLIDLVPHNPRHMRALGLQLLPQNGGSYEELERQAQLAAARTQTHWGTGGYTWVYFDALINDPSVSARLSVKAFLDGLVDIVKHCDDQEMINLLTAYCLITLKDTTDKTSTNIDKDAQAVRRKIHERAHWLVRNHLQVLHPMIWAQAALGFVNKIPMSCRHRLADDGRKHALVALEELFQREIADGHTVQFTPSGLQLPAR